MSTERTMIITHGGDAHSDEIFACAIYVVGKGLFVGGFQDLRYRIVRGAEHVAADHHVMIDVGMVHDPEKGRFDHHQDKDLPASIELVANHLYPALMEADGIFARFVKRLSMQDCLGPMESARRAFRTSRDLTGPLGSYISIERWLTKRFNVDPVWVVEMIAAPMIQDLIETEKQIVAAIAWWRTNGIISRIDCASGVVTVMHPAQRPPFTPYHCGSTTMVKAHMVDIVHLYSERNKAVLFKTERTRKNINFTRCQGMKDVEFVHPNGFLMGLNRDVGANIQDILDVAYA